MFKSQYVYSIESHNRRRREHEEEGCEPSPLVYWTNSIDRNIDYANWAAGGGAPNT